MRIRINRYAVVGSLCVIFGLSRFTLLTFVRNCLYEF